MIEKKIIIEIPFGNSYPTTALCEGRQDALIGPQTTADISENLEATTSCD